MTRDQSFLITFAKMATLVTYLSFHVALVMYTIAFIMEPPVWLKVIAFNPALWVLTAAMFGLLILNFLYIPIATSLAKYEVLEAQKRQIIYFAHRGMIDRATNEEPMKYFDKMMEGRV